MKNRSSLADAGAASAHNAEHTLKFTTVTTKGINFTRNSGGDQATDVNSAGKAIGFNVVYENITGKNSATVDAAFLLKGGLLYATATTTNRKTFKGPVTGNRGVQESDRNDHLHHLNTAWRTSWVRRACNGMPPMLASTGRRISSSRRSVRADRPP